MLDGADTIGGVVQEVPEELQGLEGLRAEMGRASGGPVMDQWGIRQNQEAYPPLQENKTIQKINNIKY